MGIYESKISKMFAVSRVFALISIVSAHIIFSSNIALWLQRLYKVVASIGVICFLFTSGYFYNPKKYGGFLGLVKNKSLTIVLPWIILGSIGFLYNYILTSPHVDFIIRYLYWIIGNGSFLYYLTVLIICFLVFYKHNFLSLIIAIILNIISLLLTQFGVLDKIIELLNITHYLNIFNWVGVFALGILCAKKLNAEKFYLKIYRCRLPTLIIFNVVIILLVVFDEVAIGYFSYIGIWLELLGVCAILGLSTFKVFDNKLFLSISEMSFSIYLIHMMVIGVFDIVYNIHITSAIFASVIIISICYLSMLFVKWISKKIKIDKFIYPIFGFRKLKQNVKSEDFTEKEDI